MIYIAHRTTDEPIKVQLLRDHLIAVRDLCAQYGQPMGLAHVFGLAGWVHDIGKYSDRFQQRIGSLDVLPDDTIRVNHAYAGARLLHYLGKATSTESAILHDMVSAIVMAHHNGKGFYDFMNPLNDERPKDDGPWIPSQFVMRMREEIPDWRIEVIADRFFAENDRQEFNTYVQSAEAEIKQLNMSSLFDYQYLYLRAAYSALIDADHAETAAFASGIPLPQYDTNQQLRSFYAINENAVQAQKGQSGSNPQMSELNRVRQKLSDASQEAGTHGLGIYSLSIPTGGGKTLSGLRFALQQAVSHHLDRIIFVVPYTTIIEQNAAEIRRRLNLPADDYSTVLEYHSAVEEDGRGFNYHYAKDTWDAPIIVTTQVAFLNALYGRGSRNSRHMHRLLNAIIVFDEIQSLPVETIAMTNSFLTWLDESKLSTSLLCTATQPALSASSLTRFGIREPVEIVQHLDQVEEQFERVRLIPHLNEVPWDISRLTAFLDTQIAQVNSVLVVLNTKKAVREAYLAFDAPNVQKFHLSTAMVTAHRKKAFAVINAALTDARMGKTKVIVFSTKLIEAGVDMSFETVVRSLAGLDSVIQVAGRCNRNHEVPLAEAHLIKMDDDSERLGSGLRDIRITGDITAQLVAQYPEANLMTAPYIKKYFDQYYHGEHNRLKYPSKETVSGQSAVMLFDLIFGEKENDGKKTLLNYLGLERVQVALKDKKNSELFKQKPVFWTAGTSVTTRFEPIQTTTTPILVPWGRGKEIIVALLSEQTPFEQISQLLKEAQLYTVQVYGDPARVVAHLGQIESLNLFYTDESSYSDEFGLGEGAMTDQIF